MPDSSIEALAKELLLRASGNRYDHCDILSEDLVAELVSKANGKQPSASVCETLRQAMEQTFECPHFNADQSNGKIALSILIGANKAELPIRPGSVWAGRAIADVAAMPVSKHSAWADLIRHCNTATSSTPSGKWQKTAEVLLEAVSPSEFQRCASEWLPLVSQSNAVTGQRMPEGHPLFIPEHNQITLRGLVWCYSFVPDDKFPQVLSDTAATTFQKIPQVGARASKVANACTWALQAVSNNKAVSSLSVLKTKVRGKAARKTVEKQLTKAAQKRGIPTAELEEAVVPSFDMQEVGARTQKFGKSIGRIRVVGTKSVITWVTPQEKEQNTVPRDVTAKHADEVKAFKDTAKAIDKALSAQKARVEEFYVEARQWKLKEWQEKYLNHPLMGVLAQQLIWTFIAKDQRRSGIFREGKLVDVTGQPLKLASSATVELWHPIDESADTVLSWRTFLTTNKICQPFEQAHREVYLLTSAEKETRTYSNRHAAHILRQTQYRAVAQTRFWKVGLIGPWDGGDVSVAQRDYCQHNLRAELTVRSVDDAESMYVSTDRVRFFSLESPEKPVELQSVPPLVFSEAMRDIDSFIAGACVGADPN